LFRPTSNKQATEQVTEQDEQYFDLPEMAHKLVWVLKTEMTLTELMSRLELKHQPNFIENNIKPALAKQCIEMAIPDKPNSPNQKYRLTKKD